MVSISSDFRYEVPSAPAGIILKKRLRQIIDIGKGILQIGRKRECGLCGGSVIKLRFAYGRFFGECVYCGLIYALASRSMANSKGMGMIGSWSGPGGGGYREYFITKMLMRDLGKRSVLLYGTGNTETFGRLLSEDIDVVGCDISQDVVTYKTEKHGIGLFFTPENLPGDKKYDIVVAVEVFEHFIEPRKSLDLIVDRLNPGGIISGTTDFCSNRLIRDMNNPGYMSLTGHVAYWSSRSMAFAAELYGLKLAEFEMVRPGSVIPDEKFGQLWPNKRVFFLYEPALYGAYFQRLRINNPILPIDKP